MDKRFSVYKYNMLYGNGYIATRQFIVLVNDDGTIKFTNFHKYVFNPNRRIKGIDENGNNRFVYVCKFLNYAFFDVGIKSLSELTVEIGKSFLNAFGMHNLPDDEEPIARSEYTVKRVVSVILDFYINLINDKSSSCSIRAAELYRTVAVRNKYGMVVEKPVPKFDIVYIKTGIPNIFRDMPNAAFSVLFDHICNYHKEILGLIMLSAFAGLRPSEACNVRRVDSMLGPGIRLTKVNGELTKVEIDLQHEYNLRSDNKVVGFIKKERTALVPDMFHSVFNEAYKIYTDYTRGLDYETDYGPFSVNSRGMAITYDSYLEKFHHIVNDELIDIYLNSDNPDLVVYGNTLMQHNLSPHVFRHWFTVQLVLSGIDEPGVIMAYRGDKSPSSALTYLNAKGDLAKQFKKVTNETFNYLLWAAIKVHNDKT